LKQAKQFSLAINLNGEYDSEIKKICSFIEKSENDVKDALDQIFETMSEVAKPIRRALPFTHAKIEWLASVQKVQNVLYNNKK